MGDAFSKDYCLREFPTPVILDQAREGAALRCKNETTFRALKIAQVSLALTGRFARNGGHGSTQNDEDKNIRFGDLRSANFFFSRRTFRRGDGQTPALRTTG